MKFVYVCACVCLFVCLSVCAIAVNQTHWLPLPRCNSTNRVGVLVGGAFYNASSFVPEPGQCKSFYPHDGNRSYIVGNGPFTQLLFFHPRESGVSCEFSQVTFRYVSLGVQDTGDPYIKSCTFTFDACTFETSSLNSPNTRWVLRNSPLINSSIRYGGNVLGHADGVTILDGIMIVNSSVASYNSIVIAGDGVINTSSISGVEQRTSWHASDPHGWPALVEIDSENGLLIHSSDITGTEVNISNASMIQTCGVNVLQTTLQANPHTLYLNNVSIDTGCHQCDRKATPLIDAGFSDSLIIHRVTVRGASFMRALDLGSLRITDSALGFIDVQGFNNAVHIQNVTFTSMSCDAELSNPHLVIGMPGGNSSYLDALGLQCPPGSFPALTNESRKSTYKDACNDNCCATRYTEVLVKFGPERCVDNITCELKLEGSSHSCEVADCTDFYPFPETRPYLCEVHCQRASCLYHVLTRTLSVSCVPCPTGTSSMKWARMMLGEEQPNPCVQCPRLQADTHTEAATCNGTSMIMYDGYVLEELDRDPAEFSASRCPSQRACQNQRVLQLDTDGTAATSNTAPLLWLPARCSFGYAGHGCMQCDGGFGRSPADLLKCVPCARTSRGLVLSWLIFAVPPLLIFFSAVVTSGSGQKSTSGIYFKQLLAFCSCAQMSALRISQNSIVKSSLAGAVGLTAQRMSSSGATAIASTSYDCLFPEHRRLSSAEFIFVSLAMPLALTILCLLLQSVGRPITGKPLLAWILLQNTFLPGVAATFSTLSVNVSIGQGVPVAALGSDCHPLGAIVAVAACLVLVPVFWYRILRKGEPIPYLTCAYKKEVCWWEACVFCRRVALTTTTVIWPSSSYQARTQMVVAVAIVCTALCLQGCFRPFGHATQNHTELTSLLISAITLIFADFVAEPTWDISYWTLDVIALSVGIMIIATICAFCWAMLSTYLAEKRAGLSTRRISSRHITFLRQYKLDARCGRFAVRKHNSRNGV